jgi:hypothetical protein
MKCASCKNKTSEAQCENKIITGLIFCGKHARVKNPRLWKDVNDLDSKVTKIQALWRGYVMKNWMKLAGQGIFNRKICHNDEDVVTMDSKESIYPLDYFSFEEDRMIYCFDIRSLTELTINVINPTNPYTRKPLSTETRQRLRKLCIRRFRRKMINEHETKKRTLLDIVRCNWVYICQIIGENGFFDIPPEFFIAMNRTQLLAFTMLIRNDLNAWALEHKKGSRRYVYSNWMKRILFEYSQGANPTRISYLISRILGTILNDYPEPYPICFIIMSAMHRL